MAFEGIPIDADLACIRKLSRVDFRNQEQFKKAGLNEDRIDLLYDIVVAESHPLSYPMIWDLQCFALKSVCPGEFHKMKLKPHIYANGRHGEYVYDPAKNGANIIKHGISFGEVVHCSPNFGSLSVPSVSERGEKLWIVFSDLNLKSNKLELPLDSFSGVADLYTMSITTLRSEDDGPLTVQTVKVPILNGGHTEATLFQLAKSRFISSRVFTRNSCRAQMAQAFTRLFPKDTSAKNKFVDHCIGYLEAYLFSSNQ